MKHKSSKVTKRKITVFAQIIQQLPGCLIGKLASSQKIKARTFSYSSQLYLLMLGQFLHAFSLNEVVDISKVHARKLTRIRGINPVNVNTFSNANRTRDPAVAESFYWALSKHFSSLSPDFRSVRNKGQLARFRTRHIYAIDASVIPLAISCIDWAPYIHRKAAAKLHIRTNVANMLPDFVIVDSARHHEATKAPEMCANLKAGDIVISDLGYYNFDWFHSLDEHDITFVSREKSTLQYRVLKCADKDHRQDGISSDEHVELTNEYTRKKYDKPFRRIAAKVEIDGKICDMTFVTNNLKWSARTIADLYKARWKVELLFKELKQTLQLQSFFGTNANAVNWQIWAALIVHLILRYMKFKSKWTGSYTRFVGLIRAAIWEKVDLDELLKFYWIAGPPKTEGSTIEMPYLPGFEKYFLKAIG